MLGALLFAGSGGVSYGQEDVQIATLLAAAKSIIEAHGGRVRVESLEGVGTTFVVELPLTSGA